MIVTCPKCHEEVLLPGGVRTDAVVRCPLCLEQYSLQDALQKLPPSLEIVHPGEGELVAVGAAVGEAEAASGYSESTVGGESAEWNPIDTPMPAPYDMPSSEATAPTPAKPKLKTSSSRAKRPQPSPVKEMVKVVLGGVVGLTLTQGFLWWGFHNDPFDLGAKIGATPVVQYLVPKHYWPKSTEGGAAAPEPVIKAGMGFGGNFGGLGGQGESQEKDAPGGKVDWDAEIKKQKGGAAASKPKPETEELTDGFDLPTEKPKDPLDFDLGDPLKVNEKPEPKPAPSTPDNLDVPEDGEPAKPAAPASSKPNEPTEPTEPAKPTTSDPEKPASPEKPAEPSTATGAELLPLALNAAKQAQASWVESTSADKEVRRKAAEQLYQSLSKLAEAHEAAAGDTDAADARQEVRALLAELSADTATRRIIEVLGATALDQVDRPTVGIALLGTVESVESADSMHVTTIVIATKEPKQVQIVTTTAPDYESGSQIFVLGKRLPTETTILASELPQVLP